jgi:flagellar hook-basal body complex protein FliE
MRVEPLLPDAPAASDRSKNENASAALFAGVVQSLGATLERAETAENAFAAGTGTLQSAIYERARADVALSVATAAAQRTAQALQSIFNLQV